MNPRKLLRSALCFVLLLSMLVGYIPFGALTAKAQEDPLPLLGEDAYQTELEDSVAYLDDGESLVPTWPLIARHYRLRTNPSNALNSVAYTYMSCMTVMNDHAYYIRTTEDRSKAILARAALQTNGTAFLTVDKSNTVTNFGEAKAMDGLEINDQYYLFIATGKPSQEIRLLHTTGNTATTKGAFTVKKADGSALAVDRLTILEAKGNQVTLLLRVDWEFYTTTVDITAMGTTATASFAFSLSANPTKELAKTVAGIPQTYPNDKVGQVNIAGMDYDSNRLYVSVLVDSCSIVLVYDNVGDIIASGTKDAMPNADLPSEPAILPMSSAAFRIFP